MPAGGRARGGNHGGRSGRGGFNRGGSGDAPVFEATAPDQLTGFDELTETKYGKKQAKLAKFSGGQGALMLDEDELEEALDLLDMWSDDDDVAAGGGKGKATQDKASKDKASKAAKEVGIDTRFLSLGAASKVDLVADFRTPKERPGDSGGAAASSAATSQEPSAELLPQKAKLELPDGVQLMGGEVSYEEQDDGSYALLLPEGAFLKASLNATPWVLEEDGRLHNFTMVLAVRLDALPSTTLPLFNGGAPPPAGEKVRFLLIPSDPFRFLLIPFLILFLSAPPLPPAAEKVENVSLYKNGGVGALNDMGTAEAAVRAERWSWLVITRKPGELSTYVNGRLCAVVKIEPPKLPEKKEECVPGKEKEKDGKSKEEEAAGPKPPLQEKFVLDPQFIALFAQVRAPLSCYDRPPISSDLPLISSDL